MTNERYQEGSEALVEMQTEHAIANVRAAATRRQCNEPWASDWDGHHCLDCEIDLPPQRKLDGRVRCVVCQTAAEQGKQR